MFIKQPQTLLSDRVGNVAISRTNEVDDEESMSAVSFRSATPLSTHNFHTQTNMHAHTQTHTQCQAPDYLRVMTFSKCFLAIWMFIRVVAAWTSGLDTITMT